MKENKMEMLFGGTIIVLVCMYALIRWNPFDAKPEPLQPPVDIRSFAVIGEVKDLRNKLDLVNATTNESIGALNKLVNQQAEEIHIIRNKYEHYEKEVIELRRQLERKPTTTILKIEGPIPIKIEKPEPTPPPDLKKKNGVKNSGLFRT